MLASCLGVYMNWVWVDVCCCLTIFLSNFLDVKTDVKTLISTNHRRSRLATASLCKKTNKHFFAIVFKFIGSEFFLLEITVYSLQLGSNL